MVSQIDAARAADRLADDFVGRDANMTNAELLTEDETFRSLAIAYQQLGYVGGPTAGVYDGGAYGDGVDRYTAAQTEAGRESIERALASRAAAVLDAAYAYRDAEEVEA